MDPIEAMIQAAPVRLRPVLMTAISTISGMIPVALSNSQGSEFRNAMGTVVIGGLASSTFLTLVVIPAAYCSIGLLGQRFTFLAKPPRRRSTLLPAPKDSAT